MLKKLASIVCAVALVISATGMMVFATGNDHMIKATGKFTKLVGGTAYRGSDINGPDAYDYTFQEGDQFQYEVYLETKMAGIGWVEIQGSKAVNGEDKWEFLRMFNPYDQEFNQGHPSADLSEVAYKKWYKRTFEIPQNFIGYRTRRIYLMVQCNEELPSEEFTFYVKNIRIVGADGKTKLDICSNDEPFIFTESLDTQGGVTLKLTTVNSPGATTSSKPSSQPTSSKTNNSPASQTNSKTSSTASVASSSASTPSGGTTSIDTPPTGTEEPGDTPIDETPGDEPGEEPGDGDPALGGDNLDGNDPDVDDKDGDVAGDVGAGGPSEVQKGGMSGGVIAGIVIAVVVVLAAIVAAVYFLVIKKKPTGGK